MTYGGRYFRNAEAFKKDAFAVLRTKFLNRRAFDRFYQSIPDPHGKNEFLRVCCSYRYLAKHGKWKVFVRGVNKDIGYLDNSFKLVVVFSLIESLSNEKHEDFFDWLIAREPNSTFPIRDKAELAHDTPNIRQPLDLSVGVLPSLAGSRPSRKRPFASQLAPKGNLPRTSRSLLNSCTASEASLYMSVNSPTKLAADTSTQTRGSYAARLL